MSANLIILVAAVLVATGITIDVLRPLWPGPHHKDGGLRLTVTQFSAWQQRILEAARLLEGNCTHAAAQSIESIRSLAAQVARAGDNHAIRANQLPLFSAPRKLHRVGATDVEFAMLASSLERAVNNEIRALQVVVENGTFVRNTADKLVYQLDNFAPMHHRFAKAQWNDVSMEVRAQRGLPHRAFVLALSSVNRETNYLLDTITNLVSHMSDAERRSIKIVLLNAEWPPTRHLDIAAVRRQFRSMLDEGTIEIVEMQRAHSELGAGSHLTERWGDDERRIRWRSKQVLDVAFLLDYVEKTQSEFRYALVLEDDIISSVNFVSCIRRWVDATLRKKTSWSVASFYNPWDDVSDGDELPPFKFFGVIGQLFRLHDLPTVVEFLRKNFDQSPLDWLFVDFLKKVNSTMVVHVPSLFQHKGRVSSFAGKEQNGASVNFVDVC